MGGAVHFRRQCLECLEGLGPKDTRPLDLPDDVDPGSLLMAKLPLSRKGRTGLGGSGNAKARDARKFYASAKWRGKGGIRDRVLIRDSNRCRVCGDRATEVHHLHYRESIWDTKVEDCVAACSSCNLDEKTRRITRKVLGS